jgi:hypothetical protein
MKASTSQNPSSNEPRDAFLSELSILSVQTKAVAKLRPGVFVKSLAELDGNTGKLEAKVQLLMDEIEASFLIIRRKLLS